LDLHRYWAQVGATIKIRWRNYFLHPYFKPDSFWTCTLQLSEMTELSHPLFLIVSHHRCLRLQLEEEKKEISFWKFILENSFQKMHLIYCDICSESLSRKFCSKKFISECISYVSEILLQKSDLISKFCSKLYFTNSKKNSQNR